MASPPEPADPTLVPRYPLALIDDIPVMLVAGYLLDDSAQQSVRQQVAYFRKWGRLRSRPLHPSERPWETLAKLVSSPQWLYGRRYKVLYPEPGQPPSAYYEPGAEPWDRQRIEQQLLRMVVALYPVARRAKPMRYTVNGKVMPPPFDEMDASQWETVVADLKQHPIRWDAVHNRYERVSRSGTAASGAVPTSRSDHPFADVQPDGHWGSVYLAVEKLRRAGIVVGYPPGSVPEDGKSGATGH
jgi:hypothetical protein